MRVYELKKLLENFNDNSEIVLKNDKGDINFVEYAEYSKVFFDDRDNDKCVVLKNKKTRG